MNREHKIRLAVINTAHARYPWSFEFEGMVVATKKLIELPVLLEDGKLIHKWVLEEWRKLS